MPTVLIVEDNDMNRDMLSRRLERRSFVVIPARDGAEAIDMATTLLPDIVLMDISLPNVDGWQATRYLKGNRATRNIPIIALTAHAMPEDRRMAAEAGCDDYETKPVDLECLLAKIRCLLAGRSAAPHEPVSSTASERIYETRGNGIGVIGYQE